MAISRAQLAKELEPGLNALFGLEYDRYENEHAEIFEEETSDRAFEEEVMLGGAPRHLLKKKALPSPLTMLRRHTPHVIRMRQSLLRFRSLKRRLKIIFMIVLPLDTPRLWLAQWLRPSKSKLRLS